MLLSPKLSKRSIWWKEKFKRRSKHLRKDSSRCKTSRAYLAFSGRRRASMGSSWRGCITGSRISISTSSSIGRKSPDLTRSRISVRTSAKVVWSMRSSISSSAWSSGRPARTPG